MAVFVRLPQAAAERLAVAALRRRTSKQDVVADLVARHLGDDQSGGARPVVLAGADRGLAPGRHSFTPADPPEVLTLAEAAALLRIDGAALLGLARAGEIPGRRGGDEWRLSRAMLILRLGGDEAPRDEGR